MKQESAFPHYTGNEINWQFGMTLRDWFAGQVAAAAMVNAQGITDETADEAFPHVARISYKLADAMIEERNKGKGE